MQSKIEEILDRFAKSYKKIDMSLDRMRDFLARINSPHLSLPKTIHIAGTNGKGSTAAFLRAILEVAGNKVHVYSSPHLLRFNERIILNGNEISNHYLEEILMLIDDESKDLDLTYYEKTTAAAFLAFSQTPSDYLILETGLGGRLDATNVLTEKEQTIITPISFDHMEYLGNTIADIAGEKAGIMLPNTLCISAPQQPDAEAKLKAYAEEIGCDVLFIPNHKKLPKLPLKGDFQKTNASVAIAAAMRLGISEEDSLKGVQFAKWPARMQKISEGKYAEMLPDNCELYLDGGHNTAAAKAICESLKPDFVIVGMLNTKDPKEFISKFAGKIKGLCAVPIEGEENSFAPEELAKAAHEAGITAFFAENIENALTDVVIRYSGNIKILVCGSLYLAAKFLEVNNRETTNV